MRINEDDENLYENLTLIVGAFEEEALRSGKRSGYMIAANSPLSGMEQILDGSEQVLRSAKTRKRKKDQDDGITIESTKFGVDTNISDLKDIVNPKKKTQMELALEGGVSMDVDLQQAWEEDSAGDKVADYLAECLGCDLRLTFDWQLKPINLLGPIANLLGGIENAIDDFLDRALGNPILDICNLLNGFNDICPQDILGIIMALKLLIKKYLSMCLEIKLDWTVVLGPLLKLILDGIAELIENVASLLAAPIDCALAVLRTESQIANAALDVFRDLEDVFAGGLKLDTDTDQMMKDVSWLPAEAAKEKEKYNFDGLEAPELGKLDVISAPVGDPKLTNPDGKKSLEFTTGFTFNSQTRLEDAVEHPLFAKAPTLDKVILALQDARAWIDDLVRNIVGSLNSLNALVSGGLSFNLKALGLLAFIGDLIAVILTVYRLIKKGVKVKDWCEYLKENPGILEGVLNEQYPGDNITVKSVRGPTRPDEDKLVIRRGPELIGEVPTCSNKRSKMNNLMLDQWISELEGKRR